MASDQEYYSSARVHELKAWELDFNFNKLSNREVGMLIGKFMDRFPFYNLFVQQRISNQERGSHMTGFVHGFVAAIRATKEDTK